MKRITAVLLSACLMLSAVFSVAAESAKVITVDVNVFTVNITVASETDGRMTLKVLNSADEILHYWQENTGAEKDKTYHYEFDAFAMDQTAPTGTYRAVIDDTYTAEFLFVNGADKGAFYKEIAAASASELEDIFKAASEKSVLDVDLKGYFSYPDGVQENVNNGVDAIHFPTLSEHPTEEELLAFADVFESEITRLISVAELFVAEGDTFDENVKTLAKDFDLDMKFYADEDLSMKPEWVANRLSAIEADSFEKDDINEAFDLAVLLALIDEAGYEAVTEALHYYDGGCIRLNTALTDDFSDTQLNKISRSIKQDAEKIKDASDVETAYETYAKEILEEAEEDDTPSGGGSSGGGGGGGGGSSTNRKPAGTTSNKTENKTEDKPVQTVTFPDVSQAPWAEEAIVYLASNGVLSGRGDGNFYPNDTVTREEFVKIIVEAFQIQNSGAGISFTDVASDRWSYPYICAAYNVGAISGISETEFNPAGNMTRQDMAVIMYRVAKLAGISLAENEPAFADNGEIADYAVDAVGALFGAGILNGMGNNAYQPLGIVTRAQAAKVVYELLQIMGGAR